MRMHRSLTTVTPLSKTIAIILFILLPFLGFYLGIRYQQMIDLQIKQIEEESIMIPERNITPTPISNIQIKVVNNKKMYINQLAGFSIQFPGSYSGDMGVNNVSLDIRSPIAESNKGRDEVLSPADLEVAINVEKTSTESLQQLGKDYETELPKEYVKMLSVTDSVIDGVNAKTFITEDPNGYQTEIILILHDGYKISISKFPINSLRQAEYEQIISSIKFLE